MAIRSGVTQFVKEPNRIRKVASSMATLGVMRCCVLGKDTHLTLLPRLATVQISE